jgi:hypothetical protein
MSRIKGEGGVSKGWIAVSVGDTLMEWLSEIRIAFE